MEFGQKIAGDDKSSTNSQGDLPFDHPYRFVIHDRDSIFSAEVDKMLKDSKVRVLKTPVRAPMANAFCEGLIGTISESAWTI